MSLSLNDPREYSTIYPTSNVLISQALHDLANNDTNQLIQALLLDLLKQGQDQTLAVAYNLAPSQAVADYIWQNLQEVINESGRLTSRLFALPIIFVTGSTKDISLPAIINQKALFELFWQKQVFLHKDYNLISGRLYDLEGIVKLKPSQLYSWTHAINKLEDWDGDNFCSANPIIALGEEIHLRYLLGVSLFDESGVSTMSAANFNQFGMELMQLVLDGVKTDGVTLFPLPFPLCRLSEAAVVGEHHHKEITVAVTLSNIVKHLRQTGKEPQIKLKAEDNNIQIEVWEADALKATKCMLWPLQRADNFDKVCQALAGLFNDMALKVNLMN